MLRIRKKWFNLEAFHKIAMLVIAVLSMFVALNAHNTNTLLAKHADNSEIGMKSVALMDSTKKHSGLVIKNTGQRPLVIKSINIYDKKGNEVPNNAYDINTEFSDIIENSFLINPIQQGETIGQNSEHWLLESKKNTSVESQMVRDFLYNMTISVCYCTANDGKCEMKNIGLKVKTINECH